MKRTISGLFYMMLGCLAAFPLGAQQVFPVSVSASLTPPNSLVLSEYTFDRADDIFFVLTLTDQRGIGRVRFVVDDASIAVPVPSGETSGDSVSRDEFIELADPPA